MITLTGSFTPLFLNQRLLVAHFEWHLLFVILQIGSMSDCRGVKLSSRLLKFHGGVDHVDTAAGSLALVRWTPFVNCEFLRKIKVTPVGVRVLFA